MSCILLSLILSQAEAARDVRDLIRALGSDGLEERDDAAARLKEIGPPAVSALEEAAKKGDPDVRGRAIQILEHIARAEKLRALRPSELRVTVELRDAPLPEALAKVLHPFGLTEVRLDESLAGRKVSLSLAKAGFWESLELLEKATGARVNLSTGRLQAAHGRAGRCGTGHARVTADTWGSRSRGGGESKAALFLKAWLPPGAWVCAAEIEEVELADGAGTRIDCEVDPDLKGGRRHGLPSSSEAGLLAIDRDSLKGVKSLNVRGTLRLGFPRDVERLEADADRLPASVNVVGGKVALRELTRKRPDSWDVDVDASGGREPYTVLLSVEDAGGRWLGDLRTFFVHPNSSIGTSGSGWRLNEGTPARFVVLRVTEVESVKVPFELAGIEPP